MSIDCKAWCDDELQIIHNLTENNVNKENDEKIQLANIDYNSCITSCKLRKHRSGGGGKRKKYIGKTKNFRSRTRTRSRTNYRKKTVRQRRRW